MDELSIVVGAGERSTQPVLYLSPSGTFAVVSLKNSGIVGAMDVYHVGTGKRATPPRLQASTRTIKKATAFADFLDELNPVDSTGALLIEREEYHRAVKEHFA